MRDRQKRKQDPRVKQKEALCRISPHYRDKHKEGVETWGALTKKEKTQTDYLEILPFKDIADKKGLPISRQKTHWSLSL